MSYTGPHSISATQDTKMEDFYVNPQTEHLDIKANNTKTLDAKFKFPKGFIRSKLHMTYPSLGESFGREVKHDCQGRITWNKVTAHIEFNKDQVFEEIDFGTRSLANNRVFVNPYYRWESDLQMHKNT